jgi:hypothetical protein
MGFDDLGGSLRSLACMMLGTLNPVKQRNESVSKDDIVVGTTEPAGPPEIEKGGAAIGAAKLSEIDGKLGHHWHPLGRACR